MGIPNLFHPFLIWGRFVIISAAILASLRFAKAALQPKQQRL